MLGPIFAIELMTAGRRARFPLMRGVYAGLLLAAMWVCYGSLTDFQFGSTASNQQANFALWFFQVFAWLQIGAVLILGPGLTAGTIAQERERKTLDYLLASDLGSREIILGKYAARFISVAWLIAAGTPVMACATLMGGIEGWNLFVVFLAAMSTLLMVAAVSLAVSVKARRARDAIVAAYLLVFCWLVVVPFAWLWLGVAARVSFTFPNGTLGGLAHSAFDIFRWLLLAPNPSVALRDLFQVRPGGVGFDTFGQPYSPWQTLGRLAVAQCGIAAICLAWSAFTVRRAHRRGAFEGKRPRRAAARWLRLPLFEPAMLWKEMFAERGGRLGLGATIARWLIVLTVLGITGWVMVLTSGWGWGNFAQQYSSYAAPMSTFLATLGLLVVAGRAATLISSEKERDSWLTLISTQLTGREIIWGKVLGNVWSARGLALLLAAVWAAGLPLAPSLIVPMGFFLLTFAILALFASAAGVMFSLRSASSMRAIAGVTALLLTLGGGYWLCCFPCLVSSGPGGEGYILLAAPTVPFLLSFPAIVFLEGAPSNSSELIVAVMAWWLGLIGYLVAGCTLSAFAAGEFDRLSGRTVPRELPTRVLGENPFQPAGLPVATINAAADRVEPLQRVANEEP